MLAFFVIKTQQNQALNKQNSVLIFLKVLILLI